MDADYVLLALLYRDSEVRSGSDNSNILLYAFQFAIEGTKATRRLGAWYLQITPGRSVGGFFSSEPET